MKKNLDITKDHVNSFIDYKNTQWLKNFMSTDGKIIPSKRSGIPIKSYRKIAKAIKRSRNINLLPFVNRED